MKSMPRAGRRQILPALMPSNDLIQRPPGLAKDSTKSQAARNYSRMAADAFARAAVLAGVEERFYDIGDSTIALRFAGKALQPIVTPALEHLSSLHHAPDLRIELADRSSLGETLPRPTSATSVPLANLSYTDGEISAVVQRDLNTLNLFDAKNNHGYFWANDVASLPWYEAGFPLRLMFHLWFRRREQFFVHAAAVGNENGAALIVGKGGSGKSTTALACLEAGLAYLGDDYSLVKAEPEPRVWSLYCSAKVTDETLVRFPQLARFLKRRGTDVEKHLLFFDQKISMKKSLPVRAVLWPRITGRVESKLIPASAATLLLALAPSSILQLPGAGAADFQMLAKLLCRVPTYILEAGTDMAKLAATVKNCLE